MACRRQGQRCGEKCGTRTKTAIDTDIEHGLEIARINNEIENEALGRLTVVIQPDPIARQAKTMISDKPSSFEQLGSFFTNASVQMKTDKTISKDLERIGQAQGKIGAEERKYVHLCQEGVLVHLRQMTTQNKEVVKQRKILRRRRLDMDAYKNFVRKGQKQHEKRLIVATEAFNNQLKTVEELLKNNEWTQKRIQSILKAFVSYQHNFHQTAANILAESLGAIADDTTATGAIDEIAADPGPSPVADPAVAAAAEPQPAASAATDGGQPESIALTH